MHGAIRMVRQGRGYGISDVPVVDLGLIGVWHILGAYPICGARGRMTRTLVAVDPKAIRVEGKPVCARCTAALGPIPMPSLVRDGEAV